MNPEIEYTCMRCGHQGTVDVDTLRGMPLRNEVGDVVDESPEFEMSGVLVIECDSCGGPTIIQLDDNE
jgi:hypothetical protein